MIGVVQDVLSALRDDPRVADVLGKRTIGAVAVSHRWQGRGVYVVVAGRRARPRLVVKLDRYARHARRLDVEHATLVDLHRHGTLRGLVPEPVGRVAIAHGEALVQTAVPGVPLSAVLRRRGRFVARAAQRDHDDVVAMATRIGRLPSTTPAATVPCTPATTLDRVARLLPEDGVADAWAARTHERWAELPSLDVPLVRCHGDLGPSNLLRHRRVLRAVDWEGGTEPSSQLAELATFLSHYARAVPLDSGSMPTRHEAVARAFLGDDGLGHLTRATWLRVVQGLGAPAPLAGPLLLTTVVDLAEGATGTAHRARARAMWRDLLGHLVERLSTGGPAWLA